VWGRETAEMILLEKPVPECCGEKQPTFLVFAHTLSIYCNEHATEPHIVQSQMNQVIQNSLNSSLNGLRICCDV
jgi:hypothetical protein